MKRLLTKTGANSDTPTSCSLHLNTSDELSESSNRSCPVSKNQYFRI